MEQIQIKNEKPEAENQTINPQKESGTNEEEKIEISKEDLISQKKTSEKDINSEKELKKVQYTIEPMCFVCKKTRDLFLCSRCKLVYYCDRECQKNDWKTHKDLCIPIANQPKRDILSIDHFKEMTKVGEGNFSDIYSAINIFNKKTYAIKIINKDKLKRIRKEADILMEKHCLKKLMGNPYVIEMYGTFQDDLNLFFQFEFVTGGELWDRIKIFGLESLSLVKYFFAQILLAVESIHSLGIVHRDLKPENILLDEKKNVKLVDFGTAKDMFNPEIKGSGNSAKGKRVYENFVGTPNFMAPECIRNKNSDYKSDIWSMGCIAFQLVNGFTPYMGGSEYLIFQKSINEQPIFPEEIIEDDLKELILLMLTKEAEKRPSLEEIKNHQFFKDVDFKNVRDKYEFYEAKITKEEEFWKDIKKKVLDENIVLTKKEELAKIMEEIREKIEKCELFESEEKKKKAEVKSKNLEKQFAHFYKLWDYEY